MIDIKNLFKRKKKLEIKNKFSFEDKVRISYQVSMFDNETDRKYKYPNMAVRAITVDRAGNVIYETIWEAMGVINHGRFDEHELELAKSIEDA